MAHSKGGLWTRQAIDLLEQDNVDQRYGVLTVHSLDTPHLGSPLASLIVGGAVAAGAAVRQLEGATATASQATNLVAAAIWFAGGYEDLTPMQTNAFNHSNEARLRDILANPQTLSVRSNSGTRRQFEYKTRYFAIGSDADQDNNGSISGDEFSGLTIPGYSTAVNSEVWTDVYRLLRDYSDFRVSWSQMPALPPAEGIYQVVITPISRPAAQPNDLIVPLASQWYQQTAGQSNANGPIIEIYPGTPQPVQPFKFSHSGAVRDTTASTVLVHIAALYPTP